MFDILDALFDDISTGAIPADRNEWEDDTSGLEAYTSLARGLEAEEACDHPGLIHGGHRFALLRAA